MLARLLQVTTVGLFALAFMCVAWLASVGALGWGLLGAALILFSYAAFLALEFVFMMTVNRTDQTPRASAYDALRAWWNEALLAPRVFCWQQPFRAHAVADAIPSERVSRRGLILVHGFVCNRAFWNPWMHRLHELGVPFIAVDLEPVFGSIDKYADIVERAVQTMEAATDYKPVIVAHSMGGLVARAWMDRNAAERRMHRVITIASPHRGTWLGRFAMTANAQQMKLDASWHLGLMARENAQRRDLFICFYSNCDNVVFPASMATLPGADNRHLPAKAHVQLAFEPEVFSEVLRWIESVPPVD
jgi:triacylglycerol lipase